jgi:hypothetical protein
MAMLRRVADDPVRGENYAVADIAAGRVGAQQSAERMEFDRVGQTGPMLFPG